MNLNKLFSTVFTLIAIGGAVSARSQDIIIEQSRSGTTSAGTNNTDFVFSGFTSTTTGNHSSAPGLVSGYSSSSRIAATGNPGNPGTNVVIFPNGGHATISGTLNPGTLTIGTTYAVAVSFSGSPTAASTDIVVTNSDTGTTGLDTFAGATSTCFQAGNGYNVWIPVGTITIASANPSIQFAYFSGVSGRWNVDSLQFTPVATPPTAQYWDIGGAIGGTGTWDTTSTNWNPNADGSGISQMYVQTNLADFRGTSGTVTITPGGITASGGLEFDVNNYTIAGGPLTLDASLGAGYGTNIIVLSTNTATINSVITGTDGLCTTGPGTLVLNTTNNLTGTVSVNAGTLSLGTNQTFTSLAGFSAGKLQLNTNTLTVGDTNNTTCTAVVTDAGAATPGFLVKQGSGTLTLNGASTFHGTTTINGGAITIGSDAALGAVPAALVTNEVTMANGSRLDFPGVFTVNAKRGIYLASGGGALSTGGSGTTVTIAGPISGADDLTIPSGSFDLTSTNTFTGNIRLVGTNVGDTGNGLSSVRFDSAAASGSGKIFMSPGSAHNVTLRTFNFTNAIVPNPVEFDPFAGAGLYLSGAIASGKVCTLAFTGNFNGTGSVISGLTTSGGSSNPGGTVALSGSNSAWSGGLTLQFGNLALGSSNALGTGTFTVGPIDSGANLVLMASNTLTGSSAVTNKMVISLAGGTTFTIGGTNDLEMSGPVVLNGSITIGVTNTGASILSGGISNAVPFSGYSLTLAGNSTLTLSGASTYDGGTFVTAGTLKVNNTTGSGTGSGAVTVSYGAALGGSGTISGTVDVAGTLSPGNSPGALATADQTWEGGGSYNWEINKASGTAGADPGWDLANITGGLIINANSGNPFVININSLTPANASGNVSDFNNAQSYTWSIAHTTTGITGFDPTAFTLNTAGFSNSLGSGSFSITTNTTDILLTFTAPSSGATITTIQVVGTNLSLSGTGGTPSGTYSVYASTNVTTALTNWVLVGTNSFDGSGDFIFNGSINPADSQRYFDIRAP